MSATEVLRVRERMARPRQRPRGLLGESGVSLGLHLALLALLLLSVKANHLPDVSEPAPVALVFEGGKPKSTPQTQDSRASHPVTAPDPRSTEPATAGGPSGAARPVGQPAPPQSASEASPESQPSAAQARNLPQQAVQVPEGPAELSVPPRVERPARAARPASAPSRPAPRTRDNPFGSLSAPMAMSLAGRPPPPASKGRLKRGIELSMAPTDQNRNVMTRYAEARRRLGEDWWAAFSAFVDAHKYYPLSAAAKGEDGQSVLHLTIARDGTVESAKIELSSGSPRLDMAWLSEFRGAKVPPFPPGTTEDRISFSASMTYILERL